MAAIIWLGRGAALGAALFFLAMRGLMTLLVGPVLGPRRSPPPPRSVAMTAFGLYSIGSQGVRATVTLSAAGDATVRLDPPDAADDVNWFTATAWQGGGLVVDRLERTAPGVYRSTQPLPLDGDWKTMLRLHEGNALTALPLYLPADPAIPVEGIQTHTELERAFGPEQKLLQRERKSAAGWLWGAAYGTVLLIALGFLVALAWGVHRVSAIERDAPTTGRFSSARRTTEREHVH